MILLTLAKDTLLTLKRTFLFHLFFSGMAMVFFWFAAQKTMTATPQETIPLILGLITTGWIWLLFSGYAHSPSYSPMGFLRNSPGLLFRGLFWIFTVFGIWGNPYTQYWAADLAGGNTDIYSAVGISVVISFSYLATLFVMGLSILAPWKNPVKDGEPIQKLGAALWADVKTIFLLMKASWQAGLLSLVLITLFFFPLSILGGLISMLANVSVSLPGQILTLGLTWLAFSLTSLLVLSGSTVMRHKMIGLGLLSSPTQTPASEKE